MLRYVALIALFATANAKIAKGAVKLKANCDDVTDISKCDPKKCVKEGEICRNRTQEEWMQMKQEKHGEKPEKPEKPDKSDKPEKNKGDKKKNKGDKKKTKEDKKKNKGDKKDKKDKKNKTSKYDLPDCNARADKASAKADANHKACSMNTIAKLAADESSESCDKMGGTFKTNNKGVDKCKVNAKKLTCAVLPEALCNRAAFCSHDGVDCQDAEQDAEQGAQDDECPENAC